MLDTINGLLESLNLCAVSQLRHLTSDTAAKVVVEVDAGQIILFETLLLCRSRVTIVHRGAKMGGWNWRWWDGFWQTGRGRGGVWHSLKCCTPVRTHFALYVLNAPDRREPQLKGPKTGMGYIRTSRATKSLHESWRSPTALQYCAKICILTHAI